MVRPFRRCTVAVLALALLPGVVGRAQQGPGPAPLPGQTPKISSADASGHRLWVMLFDVGSMQTDEVVRARLAALQWVNTRMSPHDLVSIVTVHVSLNMLQNFTTDIVRVRSAVRRVQAVEEFGPAAPHDAPDLQERDAFNNDLRFRGLRTLCDGLRSIDQRKAILFFTSTQDRPGFDNQVEVRAATDSCNQANASINPVDLRDTGGGGGPGGFTPNED